MSDAMLSKGNIACSVDAFKSLSLDTKLTVLYETQLSLFQYVMELEKKAADMANPEKVQEMMSSMMGGLFS